MNLKDLSDDILVAETKKLLKEEREILSQILHHLAEIERRRLYIKFKYASLFEYAEKDLGCSSDQADRLNDGSLSPTHLERVQSLLEENVKVYSKEEKLELLSKILGKTDKRG